VDVDGDRVVVDGNVFQASFEALPGTPLRCADRRRSSADPRGTLRRSRSLGYRGQVAKWRELEVVDERTRYIRSLAAAEAKPAGAHVLKLRCRGWWCGWRWTRGKP
jgi:hypothetical protein